MPLKYSVLALLTACLSTLGTALAADSHRLLVLDIGRWPNNRPGSDHHQMLVVEVESGKVLARVEIGCNTHLAVSCEGEVIAAISHYWEAGRDGQTRLEFFRAKDLKRLGSRAFPSSLPLLGYQLGAASDCRLSPKGQELIVQGVDPSFRGAAHLATTGLNCVQRVPDREGFFKCCPKTVRVPRCYGVGLLRVADWPKVDIWNANLGLLEVVDFASGKILSTLRLGNDPALASLDPAKLETADTKLIFRLRNRGVVVADGGRYAFYIPQHPYDPREPIGFIQKIDLAANPPKVIRKGEEPQPNLYARTAVVSEAAGALFVVKANVGVLGPNGSLVEPTRRVQIFSTKDLKLQREIELPLDFNSLKASRDGKYLYALSPDQAKLAVIEVATGREVKTLDNLGKYPHILIALPQTKAGE